jgi:hypothetical protein
MKKYRVALEIQLEVEAEEDEIFDQFLSDFDFSFKSNTEDAEITRVELVDWTKL